MTQTHFLQRPLELLWQVVVYLKSLLIYFGNMYPFPGSCIKTRSGIGSAKKKTN